MNTHFLRCTPPSPPVARRAVYRRSAARRGLATGALLLGLLTLLAVMGLALELGLIYHAEIQLQTACDAAALAGAVELLDDSVLYPDREPDTAGRIAAAQEAALAYAQANPAAGAPVALLPNQGDVEAGWLLSPERRGSEFLPWVGQGPVNTLRVRAVRAKGRNNPLRLWIAPVVGVHAANVAARSQATVDSRVYGFRPLGDKPAPLVPLAARHDQADDAWLEQSKAPAEGGDNDNYRVDFRTGSITSGADGIPEIELRMPTTEATDSGDEDDESNLGLLQFGATLLDMQRQIQEGIRRDDLALWDGALALDADGERFVPGTDRFNPALLSALASIRGQNRIWPLFGEATEQSGTRGYVLTGFAAGCLVSAEIENDELILIVQPSLLISAAALVGELPADRSPNAWIAKLLLTH